MKKILILLVMLLNVAVFAVAQDDDADNKKQDGGRIEALKIAYLTKKLNLSTEEAQKFWPIYNQYIAEVRKTRQEARANNTKEIDVEEKLLNIRKRYDGEFSKALTKEKVNTFFRAEKEFGTVLQKELLERRQNQLNRRRLKQIP
jgi:hypothetical protein